MFCAGAKIITVNDIFSLAPCADLGQFQGRCPGYIFFIAGNFLCSVEFKYYYEIKLIYVVQNGQGECKK